MAKTLKIWNGRGFFCRKLDDPLWENVSGNATVHAYVAAYSRADACRVIEEYAGRSVPDTELRVYWHEGAWGNRMEGISPERGLWLAFNDGAPVRVI